MRAAVAEAARLVPKLPLIAGGKSFGGRMTSQAQARSPLPRVRGLGVPRLPAARRRAPVEERAAHLFEVKIPMLFLQGTRDALADIALMRKLVAKPRQARNAGQPSPTAITPSMCPHALDGAMKMSEPKCLTLSPAGSKPRSDIVQQYSLLKFNTCAVVSCRGRNMFHYLEFLA